MLWEIPLRNSQFLLSRSDPWRSPMWHRSHEVADNVDWISQRAGFLMFWISTAISENDWIWFGTCLNPRKPIWHGSLDWEVFACGGCKSCSASLLPRLSQQDYLLRPGWGHCPVRFVLCFSVSANPRPFSAAAMLNQVIATWMARCSADFSLTLVTDMWQNSK